MTLAIRALDRATYPDPDKATPVPILFLDSETTSLRVPWRSAPRRPWEIGAIRRETDGAEHAYQCFVEDVDLTDADPLSLSFGHFYDRHPQYAGGVVLGTHGMRREGGDIRDGDAWRMADERDVAYLIAWLARGAHIVGAVPDFDTSTLDQTLERWGLAWPGHYHLICAEVYAAGAIGWTPPYDSKELSLAIGVDPANYPPHRAFHDARWARDLYDAARTWSGERVPQPR
jgi:hypothetical protein